MVGTVIAAVAGRTDFSDVGRAKLIALPTFFPSGTPTFEVGAIVSMTIVILVIMTENIADILPIGEIVGTEVDSGRVADGLRADMAATAAVVLFGSVAASGIRTLTRVRFHDNLNMLIVAVAIAAGLIPIAAPTFWDAFPESFAVIMHSGISATAIVAILLNLLFNELTIGNRSGASVFAAAQDERDGLGERIDDDIRD
ncbi:hypothetical protein OHB26_27075 [Nocardia sp. NBC_01503]|uniref:solute carrier family 23 protein n=1 Tax=Nocardia sp. NBC_01503 TaxID=2975997 RepID=UPI002E7B8AA4|nr:solute carrier family 23 protein [Nocardia sp. NBC_01503]WTL30574.1 hypothetical protein OHB26_27075 [Nocardia sp. NBC_01503]